MPEIWLNYGQTDVVLDIKHENLFSHYQAQEPIAFSSQEFEKIENIKLDHNMLVFAFSASKEIVFLLDLINKLAFRNRIKINFGTLPHLKDIIKKKIQNTNIEMKKENLDKVGITNDEQDYKNIENEYKNENIVFNTYNLDNIYDFNKFSNILFLSKVTYDPIFGFGGSITNFLKNFGIDKMNEAFNARKDNNPSPGVITESLKIALEYAKTWNQNGYNNNHLDNSNIFLKKIQSIEIVTNQTGVSSIYKGDLVNNFESSINDFVKDTKIETDFTRSLIVSAGPDVENHLILNKSLDSIWNAIHAVKGNGTIILVAENKLGLGDGALKMFVEGRLHLDTHVKLDADKKYVNGMEHLLYIEEFKNKIELGIVSSLPEYFSSKLGLTSFRNMKGIIEHLLERNGKSHKISILSNPERLLLAKTN